MKFLVASKLTIAISGCSLTLVDFWNICILLTEFKYC